MKLSSPPTATLLLVSFSLAAAPARAQFDVEVLAGTGLTNVTAGPTHSATGSPATIGADELITTLTTLGSVELNTGVGGAEPGDITSLGISISGTVGLGAPGALTFDAANNINLGGGGILLDSTTLFAPDINLNAGDAITLGALESTGATAGGAINLNAGGNITTSSIDTRSVTGNGGAVSIFTAGGQVNGGSIVTSSLANGDAGNGGNILIEDSDVATNLTLNTIDTSSQSLGGSGTVGNGGSVTIGTSDAVQTINISNIDTSVISANGSGGSAGSVQFVTDSTSIITMGTILARSDVARVQALGTNRPHGFAHTSLIGRDA